MELRTPSSSYSRGLLGVSPVFPVVSQTGASLGPSPSPHDGDWPTDEKGTLQDLLCEEVECSTPSSSSWRVDPGVSPPSSLVNRTGGVVADPSPALLNREDQDTVQTILLVEQEHCGSSRRRFSWPLSMVERLMLAETGEMDCFVPSNTTSAKKTGVKKKSVKTTSVKKKSVKKKKKSVKKKTSVAKKRSRIYTFVDIVDHDLLKSKGVWVWRLKVKWSFSSSTWQRLESFCGHDCTLLGLDTVYRYGRRHGLLDLKTWKNKSVDKTWESCILYS